MHNRLFSISRVSNIIVFENITVVNTAFEKMENNFRGQNLHDKTECPGGIGRWTYENILDDMTCECSIFVGGFGVGTPHSLLNELSKRNLNNLQMTTETRVLQGTSIQKLFLNQQVSNFTTSYFNITEEMQQQFNAGTLELHISPMGTIVEQIHAGGSGIPAFFTHVGADTIVEKGGRPYKIQYDGNNEPQVLYTQPIRTEIINGKKALYYESRRADFAFIQAYKADKAGNLCFTGNAKNLNDVMATAANVVIVEAEEIVEIGELLPDEIHLPGIFVHRLIKCDKTLTQEKEKMKFYPDKKPRQNHETKRMIARMVLEELNDGDYVNLGVGTPMLLANFCHTKNVIIQIENGLLGAGSEACGRTRQFNVRGPESIPSFFKVNPGASFFGSSMSFTMIRGGHINVTVLGALEVTETGDFSSWTQPWAKDWIYSGMGGAMDLVSHPKTRVIIAMQLVTGKGKSRIVKHCTHPLTAKGVVDTIVTDKNPFIQAVFKVSKGRGLRLTKICDPKLSVDDLRKLVEANFIDDTN